MNPHYDRGMLLFQRERFEEAVHELQQAIASDHNDPFSHGLMALCLSRLDRHQQALEAAGRCIEVAPDSDYGHYVLARVFTDRSRLKEARDAIKKAIELDPDDANNHGLLARIEFESDNWSAAVAAAEAGLALDPESDICLHYRSLALVKLGRMEEAEQDQQTLLAADPDDPYTHAARGWTLLEKGEADKAKEHFLEALRLDPGNADARAGLANALKAKHFLFGVALRALLYLDRFRAWIVWIFFIGVFIGLRQLDRLALIYPDATVMISLVKAAFWFCLLLIMLAHPLFDLILRLDREGRRALTADEIKASNWHAVCLIAALSMGLMWAWRGDVQMRVLALATMMLTYAITHTFLATPGWVRNRMGWITIFAAMLIPLSFVSFVSAIILTVKFKVNAAWMIKPALVYLPMTSTVISMFADNFTEFLEKRRPDAASH